MRTMKDSGCEWIGSIPEEWNTEKIKHHFTIGSGTTPKSDIPEYWDGDIVWITPADFKTDDVYVDGGHRNITRKGFDESSLDLVPSGSIIFSKRAPIGQVVINSRELCTNQGCLTAKPLDDSDVRYYRYVMSVATEEFELSGSGTTFKEISASSFANTLLPSPMPKEQRRISDYLDTECAKIDSIIAKQERIIAKLKEYRLSLITEAVTKGIKPNVEMKDSGIEWIKDIPASWEIRRGKTILSLMKRNPDNYGADEVITCFRDGEVTLRKNRREEGFTFSDKEIGYQGINKGDLVIHGMDGFAGAIGISDSDGKGSPVLVVCDSMQNKKFIMYYLRMLASQNVFLSLATGIRERSCDLRWNKIADLLFPLPSIEEQEQIATYIDEKNLAIESAIEAKKSIVEKYREYKKALIYEVVTGKKEV